MLEHAALPPLQIAEGVKNLRRKAQGGLLTWSGHLRAKARHGAPAIALMPTAARQGASLLRIYYAGQELRRLGWQVILLPPRLTLGERLQVLAAFRPDIVLMQTARHSLNRPQYYPGHKVVIDMDDADFHLPWLEEAIAEDVQRATGIVAGSEYISDWCRRHGARSADIVWTGSPPTSRRRSDPATRPPIVAWPQGYPSS